MSPDDPPKELRLSVDQLEALLSRFDELIRQLELLGIRLMGGKGL